MSSLCIVESPAKCSKIQGFLGAGWRVIASMGHIRALDEDLDAVGLERDFEPRYAFLKDKAKAIAGLRAAAKEAAHVYLASDDDREGEAISYSVAVLLGLPVATTPRIVFHEITKQAVTAAIASPRRIDMNRVNAQQARAVLDMMVGFTISPLLWKFVGTGLSAGRCQTPALRLVADRETEITEFQSETTWSVCGTWCLDGAHGAQAPFEAVLTDALEDEESATNYLENIHNETDAVVKEAITKPTTEAAPKPLITSTLQQEASALYGSQPKNTMRIAQRLYEAGHITYMRTDHAVLCEEARLAAEAYVTKTYGEGFVAAAKPAVKPVAKKATATAKTDTAKPQEAHEAIRPTHVETTDLPVTEDWSAVDRKLYKLIWNRTIQSVMTACKGEERRCIFVPRGDPAEMEWLATWRRTTFQGWRRVGQAIADLDETDVGTPTGVAPTGAWTLGLSLEAGSVVKWTTLEAQPKETRPPGRYTEATLVRELERKGIGRPSTFASLVATLLDKQYVEKRDTPAKDIYIRLIRLGAPNLWPPTVTQQVKKVGAERQKLAATPLGLSALEFCMREFAPLFAYEFTKGMEDRLDRVADGTEQWKSICRDTWGAYKERYTALKSTTATQTQSDRQKIFGTIKAVQSKKGPLLLIEGATKEDVAFFGWPAGVSFKDMTEEVATAHVEATRAARASDVIGEYEGKPIQKHSGPYGAYVTCDSVNVPFAAGDTVETIIAKLEAKRDSVLHSLGPFEFRKGPYGIFFFKKDVVGKARKFVSLPAALDPKALTLEAATKIYQTGLQQKAKAKAFGGPKKKDN